MRYHAFVFALFFSLLVSPLLAEDPVSPASPRLKVGIVDRPPFALKDEDGRWDGLAVDLWEKIAADLNLTYDYVEVPFDDLIPGLVKGKLDVVVGEMGVSAERERLVDFTQPYLTSSSAVALSPHAQSPLWEDVSVKLAQHGVLLIVIAMIVALVIFSLLLWFAERNVNRDHFGGHPVHGLGSALWFAAVTMTTVGYGDKTPQSPMGRALAFVWMFFGILIVGAFTGAIASSFTLSSLRANVDRMGDLNRFRNGVLEGSLAQTEMNNLGIAAERYASVQDGLRALQQGQISAFVANDATLRYLNNHNFDAMFEVVTLPSTHVSFAMACRPGFPFLQEINIDLIRITSHVNWQKEIDTWLGSIGQK